MPVPRNMRRATARGGNLQGMDVWQYGVLFGAAAVGGAINAVAGGGTLLTFPALLWASQPEIVANATSTVALWPGQLGSLWGYRKEVGRNRRAIVVLALPSFLGGVIGAVLLLRTGNDTFRRLVPYLILLATCLFMAQEPLSRWLRRRGAQESVAREGAVVEAPSHAPSVGRWVLIVGFQLVVAIYGGYFGAGIGILMLAALGLLGFTNIHQMNGLKNINGMCINGVAAFLFITKGLVDWRLAMLMAAGAITGGYTGAGVAQRVGQRTVRRIIVLIGFALTISLLVRQ
ncbi:MAG: sulfite exporter TauE/SafE family protein [Chloroherpetonaceae bacterium]|nr:sulfite exporter TauE/SafE family protein [Chthonomonadaceae bacterium]MDW8208896.1 sulfite exporter TauE/SafE family protein [Chloroherpetonaceae bacterium]